MGKYTETLKLVNELLNNDKVDSISIDKSNDKLQLNYITTPSNETFSLRTIDRINSIDFKLNEPPTCKTKVFI